MEHGLLKRAEILRRLENIYKYPLTLVTAAMGSGKTTAVRAFLASKSTPSVWLSAESEETSAQSVWHSLTGQFARAMPEYGSRLQALGFPSGARARERVFGLIEDAMYGTGTVLVVDDYHSVRSPEFDALTEQLVRKNIPGFHIVLISRSKPAFAVDELIFHGLCCPVTGPLFELSLTEITEYFALSGLALSPSDAELVQAVTGGWMIAVSLTRRRTAETGRIEPGTDIGALIASAVTAHCTPAETDLLATLSVFGNFTPEQAVFLTGDAGAPETLRRLGGETSLIRFDAREDRYVFHDIFRSHLAGLLSKRADGEAMRALLKRAGEWEIRSGSLIAGFEYYLRAGEYDLILTEFENPGITRVLDSFTAGFVRVFGQIPEEALFRHPAAWVKYADFHLINVSMEEGSRMLDEIERHYLEDPCAPPALRRRIFGEIALSRSFTEFNDVRRMHLMHLRAYELLGGRSSVANRHMSVTFGSPHALYLYHKEKGGLLALTELFTHAMRYFTEMADGCGTGFEHLVRAEYCLETGDTAGAETAARKAVYKAETAGQTPVILCARFVLARMYVCLGKFAAAEEVLDEMAADAADYENKVDADIHELCAAYMGMILGDKKAFAPWLRAGGFNHSDVFYQSVAFHYLAGARYCLLDGNYLRLEVLCEELHRHFSVFGNLFGHLHAHILAAVSALMLYGSEKAREALLPALEIGRADNLILPFAEYAAHISGLLAEMSADDPDDGYLRRLASGAARYKTNLNRHLRASASPRPLTAREKQILQLVIEGRTNREISSSLYVAEVTVKKAVTCVYRKLGVNGRAAAVRRATEEKII